FFANTLNHLYLRSFPTRRSSDLFFHELQLAFKEIATIQLSITAIDDTYNEKLLQDYWYLALANQNCDTPLIKQILKSQTLKIDEKKIVLPVSNEAVIPILQQQYLPLIEENYRHFGFRPFKVKPFLDQTQKEAELKELAQRQKEQQE